MKINQFKKVQVNAKILKLHLKVRDCFDATLVDSDGKQIGSISDYVPNFMPGEHFGDYVILDIDIDTGFIVNWGTPTAKQIEEAFKEKSLTEEE